MSRPALLLPILVLATLGAFVLLVSLGTVHIPAGEVVNALIGRPTSDPYWRTMVLDFRLPRALTALVAGGAVGVSGLLAQTVFRNPLAAPWALGITAGAQLGVAVSVVAAGAATTTFFATLGGFASLGVVFAASLGAAATLALVLAVSHRVGAVTLLVVGFMLMYLLQGVAGLVVHLGTETAAKAFVAWNDGNFGGVTWDRLLPLAGPVLLALVLAYALLKPLNAFLLGERYARSLGVNVRRTRLLALLSIVGLSGTVTAHCGPIVFLDIAVPHLARGLLKTTDHRFLIPACALLGAMIALLADAVMHLPGLIELFHLNSLLGLVGAPVVMWVVLGRKRAVES